MPFFPACLEGNFGLERETLRVDAHGALAQTPHPFRNPAITRDFCENQIEIITPVCHSISEMLASMAELDAAARKTLAASGERLWLYSNPPHFSTEDDIPVADFTGGESGKRHYREALQSRYGKRLMLYSGIHFNFSFSEAYLRTLWDGTGDFAAFCDQTYLRLYQQICRKSWLLVLLSAASPVYDRSLDGDGLAGAVRSPYASMRSSERGYWNRFVPILDHTDLRHFTDSIRSYVTSGKLFSASELYLPVRLKPRGVNSVEQLANGVSHIELRMFDLNPTQPLGIDRMDLELAHRLLVYLSVQPDFDYTPALQEEAIRNHKNAARYDLDGVTIDGEPILDAADRLLRAMAAYFAEDVESVQVIAAARQKLHQRLCTRITPESIYQ